MTLRKNTDPTLQATHTIDLKFSFADGAPFSGFKDVGLPQMRKEDSTAVETLTSVKVKISDVYFLIALARGNQDTAHNLNIIRTRTWFDFPLLLNDNRIAKIVFQKSTEGEAMLNKAFDAWGSETPASPPEQVDKAQPPLNQPSPDANTQPAAVAKAPIAPASTAPRSDEVGANAPFSAVPMAPIRPKAPDDAQVGAPALSTDTLPQYKFARAVKDSPTTAGNADSRYFTIVYGMIRSHYHEPSGPGATRPVREGAIVFSVDNAGNIIGRKVVSSSGSLNLDTALMTAIAEAAPFPAPPNWQPKTLRLTYGR
jgi:TonB family protein